MKFEIIKEVVTPLTDEEIIAFQKMKQKNTFPLSKMAKWGTLGGLAYLISQTKAKPLNRRDFLKALGITGITSGLVLGSDDEAESFFWALLIGAVLAYGAFSLAKAFGRAAGEAAAESYTNTSQGNVFWKQKNGGLVSANLVNSTDQKKQGIMKTGVLDYESNTIEFGDNVGVIINPYEKKDYHLRYEELPYSGAKKVQISAGGNEVQTDNLIHVV